MDAPLSWGSENMTVTNNGLICQRYYTEEEYLNECVGVLHAYMYITDSVEPVTVP